MTTHVDPNLAAEAAAQAINWATWSALFGIAGSVLLAVPVLLGLKGRRAFETDLALYRASFQNGTGPTDDEREDFKTAMDTFLVEALGSYHANRLWTLLGLGALTTSFVMALAA